MDISLIEFIPKEMYLIMAGCYALGMLMKKVPKIPDWTIPIILLVFSVITSILYLILITGFSYLTILNGLMYGIINAAVAVFGNQVIKQIKEK